MEWTSKDLKRIINSCFKSIDKDAEVKIEAEDVIFNNTITVHFSMWNETTKTSLKGSIRYNFQAKDKQNGNRTNS